MIDFAASNRRRMKNNTKSAHDLFTYYSNIDTVSRRDATMRNVFDFLIRKYPQSKHKVMDTELARHVEEVH